MSHHNPQSIIGQSILIPSRPIKVLDATCHLDDAGTFALWLHLQIDQVRLEPMFMGDKIENVLADFSAQFGFTMPQMHQLLAAAQHKAELQTASGIPPDIPGTCN